MAPWRAHGRCRAARCRRRSRSARGCTGAGPAVSQVGWKRREFLRDSAGKYAGPVVAQHGASPAPGRRRALGQAVQARAAAPRPGSARRRTGAGASSRFTICSTGRPSHTPLQPLWLSRHSHLHAGMRPARAAGRFGCGGCALRRTGAGPRAKTGKAPTPRCWCRNCCASGEADHVGHRRQLGRGGPAVAVQSPVGGTRGLAHHQQHQRGPRARRPAQRAARRISAHHLARAGGVARVLQCDTAERPQVVGRVIR